MDGESLAFRLGQPGLEQEQRQLWHTVFCDSGAYIDAFYNNLYSPEHMALAVEDGVLAAMCALLPVSLRLPGGGTRACAYLYALAVDPTRRSRGIAHRLLSFVDYRLSCAGLAAICTVPAGPSLHRFFASAGYREGFVLHAAQLTPDELPPVESGDRLRELGPEAYLALREGMLVGRFHVAYDAAFLAHQREVLSLSGGGLYGIEARGERGLAAVEFEAGAAVVKELLIAPAALPHACALLAAALPAPRYRLRTPDGPGVPVPFGMLKWYDGGAAPDGGYLAFALD